MNILSALGVIVAILASGLLLARIAGLVRAAGADAYRAGLQANCEPDGTLITSEDRLRATITSLDRTARIGRAIDGSKTDLQLITYAADVFARQQASPSDVLHMLHQCDEYLVHEYSVGYFVVTSALIREIARRKVTK